MYWTRHQEQRESAIRADRGRGTGNHPADGWVWLPAPDRWPAAFADLGAGARLGVLVEAVDTADPTLRDRIVATMVRCHHRHEAHRARGRLAQRDQAFHL